MAADAQVADSLAAAEEGDLSMLPRLLSTPIQEGRRRRRVAVYGGAYDPITVAHLSCAAQIIHSRQADEVMIVPCGPRPDKPNLKTSILDRYVMCQIAVNTMFQPAFPIQVSDAETRVPKALATYDLLSILRKQHPDCDFVFVLGSDWLQPGTDLREWESAEGKTGHRLIEEYSFLVVKRPGYSVENLAAYGPNFSWLALPDGMKYIDSNLSSTEVRNRILSQPSEAQDRLMVVDGLVPPGVLAFIKRKGLYKPPRVEAK